MPGYRFLRSDRDFITSGKSRAGGLLIYFKKEIKFKLLACSQFNTEYVIAKFTVGDKFFLLSLAYQPPATTVSQSHSLLDSFSSFIQELSKYALDIGDGENTLLLGDF